METPPRLFPVTSTVGRLSSDVNGIETGANIKYAMAVSYDTCLLL